MGFKEKMKNFIAPEDEMLELDDYDVSTALSDYEKPRNKNASKLSNNVTMKLYEPRSFDETEVIAADLKNRKAVFVNFHRLQKDYAQRTIDFLTGVTFALDGKIEKVGHNTILCTPRTMEIEGEINLDLDEL
ncbi:MAG: cell division protein SepF [Erysipelothrix sp.]|nr:cell division protein SepF [Erysipelothrix sp.]